MKYSFGIIRVWIFMLRLLPGIILPVSLQATEIKVVLTANTADLKDSRELFMTIDAYSAQATVPVVWVLNGDVFPEKATSNDVQAWLTEATRLLSKYEHLTIVLNQGDREWKGAARDGWKAVQELEKQMKKQKHARLVFFLENGCPGPWFFSFAENLDMIVFNSQWWSYPGEKPMPYMNACSIADEGVFMEKIIDLLDDSRNRNVLLLSHFPLASAGRYGGRFPVSSYLLPPVVGSALVSFHQTVGTDNDIVNERFDGFRHRLDEALSDYSSIIVASGHERNHSILKSGNNFYINSGAFANGDFAAHSKDALLISSRAGFIELTYDTTGQVTYRYLQRRDNMLVFKQGDMLIRSTPVEEDKDTTVVAKQVPVVPEATVVAGPEYTISTWGEWWFGKHYRTSWTTPVHVPYLNMDTTFQGLTVVRRGGGRQTTSLKLLGSNGREYVFRSVNKDPSKALSHSMRGTLVSRLIKDQTTTQQPYGALAASYLLDRTSVLHARPALYVLPEDEKLGRFNEQYGGLLGMLEDSPTDKIRKNRVFGGADHIERSYKLFQKLYEDHDNRVDRYEFCRARVFDILVGDWGKHEDNWKWAGYKEQGGVLYRPIPRDRDHVFSRWDGIIPYLADREWAKPTGENFDYTIKGLRSLMQQARHMDRLLGNQLTREDWITAAKEIQRNITDADIEKAIKQMPAEIYNPDGKEIEAKLKARIKDLARYAEQYYEMLATEVDVVGSNKAEYFKVTRNANGTVDVLVCDLDNGIPDLDKVYYSRRFLPEETDEIRLYGLTNADVFVVTGQADNSILVRIISDDKGDKITDDSFVKGSSHKTLVYQKDDRTTTNPGKEARRIIPRNRALYHYERTAFAYNTYFPLVLLTYNPFTGLALNTRVTFTNHNFSKPDFSTKHTLGGSVSTEGNYELSYKNQLRYLAGTWDGVTEVTLSRPLNYNYFFGIGNDTEKDRNRNRNYYRAQYNSLLVSAGLTRSFWKYSSVLFAASFESAKGIIRRRSFLNDNPIIFGMQHLDMTSVKAVLDLDFRNDRFLPERGFRLGMSSEALHITHGRDEISSINRLDIEHYLSTYNSHPVTLGIRAGGGVSTGDLPFYKLFSLGQLNDLHGFKRNRFTGESKAYVNTELRWQILETRNNLIPVKIGVRAFYDIGRVWAEADPASADYWHHGYGGGFYVVPFMNQFSFNINAGTSKEESFLLMFGIGGSF